MKQEIRKVYLRTRHKNVRPVADGWFWVATVVGTPETVDKTAEYVVEKYKQSYHARYGYDVAIIGGLDVRVT